MTNRKAIVKGTIKISFIVAVLVALGFLVFNYVLPVLAAHSSTAAVSPGVVQASTDYTFTVTIGNDGGSTDPISEVRIYHDSAPLSNPNDFTNYACYPKTGWYGPFNITSSEGTYCLYTAETTDDRIAPGEFTDFTFSATSPETESCRNLHFESRDPQNVWLPLYDDVCVDKDPPVTTKSFEGPQKINENGVEWIDGVTQVVLNPTDPEPHPSGVDKTWYVNILDESEDACWYPNSYCQSPCDSPYDQYPGAGECINSAQEWCDQNWDDPEDAWDWNSWEECVEDLVYSECQINCDGEKWQLYNDGIPIQKDEESCHVLQFFSVDNIGNVENVNDNCFFVDKTPPEISKEVGDPEITGDGIGVSYYLTTTGDATAEISDDQAYEGDDSIKLHADLITDYPPTNEARIYIPVDSFRLKDIDTIEWMTYVTMGYIPHVDIILDFDEDGIRDDALVVEYDKEQAPSDQPLGDMNFGRNEWVNTFDDKGSIDDSSGMWLSSGAPGPVGGAGFIYGTLADWKAGTVDPSVDGDTKVIALEIEVDGWIAESEAYVDSIKLNGENMQIISWVTQNTPITFECYDQRPHPSEDEVVCYKVSFDDPETPYLTADYCGEFGGTMEGEWCCADVYKQNNQYSFTFGEDSVHDLVYYCKDAVEKRTATYLQYYKVDNTPPVIEKEMLGVEDEDWMGDCPPSPEPSDDECYVADNGKGGVKISVEDPEPHPVNDVSCYYELWLEGQVIQSDEFGEEGGVDIYFTEDSEHTLKVNCEDALGNKMTEDVEEFLVDSTAPETEKTYGEPFVEDYFPKGCNYNNNNCNGEGCDGNDYDNGYRCGWAEWINSITPIYLDATDEKVGVDKIFWRNLLVTNPEAAYYICGHLSGDGIQDYCNPEFYYQYVDPQTPWNEYTDPFYKPEESCHIIEYYSVDELGNEEDLNWQCVFVDNTPPEVDKEIGEPKVVKGNAGGGENGENNNNSPGDIIYQLDVSEFDNPGYTEYCSIGLAFDGSSLYYNRCSDENIYKVDPITGELQDTFDTGLDDEELYPNAMAYDATRNGIWFGTQSCNDDGMPIYFWDFDDDSMTLMFAIPDDLTNPATGENFLSYCFNDGLAFNANDLEDPDDDEIWFSDDVNKNLGLFRPDGTFVAGYDSTDTDDELSYQSGLAIGGQNLYMGNDGGGEVFRADKDTLELVDLFVSEDERLEDMECDPITFAPIEVMWVRHTPQGVADDDLITAFEIEEGTCGAGGKPPEPGNVTIFITTETPITLSCWDIEPHPVDHVSLWYRYRFAEDCDNLDQAEWTEWFDPNGNVVEKTIYFEQDSCHELEYYCEDGLGNVGPTQTEIDIVDIQPPVITKEIVGPQYGDCPPNGEGDCYIDGVTEIYVDVYDPEPHPVNEVSCYWEYYWNGNLWEGDEFGEEGTVITFDEDSEHELYIYCEDALGNWVEDQETFLVDKTPPVTWKRYGEPFFANGAEWITSNTPISLGATDEKSGVAATYWRNTLVADENCWEEELCQQAVGSGEWNSYTNPFNKGEESCHLIEYYSVDNVNKTEEVNKQCVFVDNSPPEPNKTVGKPRTEWDGSDANFYDIADKCWSEDPEKRIECWKVTLFTPITLDCNDPEPHPVDNEETCFKVEMDGDDVTGKYCDYVEGNYNNTGDGFCCGKNAPFEFHFNEETEHELEYYCVDALGNRGEKIDVEKFKVEGTNFEIQLNKKWNLISVPFVMLDGSIDEVFSDIADDIKIVWTYDRETDEWFVWTPNDGPDTLTEMIPGWGYWVKALDDTMLLIGGSLFSPAKTPPSKAIVSGWNLIGYYGTEEQDGYFGPDGNGKEVQCALYSLGDSIRDKEFASLWTYWEPYNPNQWIPYDKWDSMDPGAGYWLFTAQNGEYAVTTTCR